MARKFATESSRDPLDLHPQTRDKLLALLVALAPLGIAFKMLDTARSPDVQNALYTKGRTTTGSIVTYARADDTYHTKRRAFDIALLLPQTRSLDWTWMESPNALAIWEKVAEYAEAVGLTWGGRWTGKKQDKPHFEDRFCAKCGADHKAKQFDSDGECREAGAVKEEEP